MIRSMTGFGVGTLQKDDLVIEAEIKSLNSKFLELSIRSPKSLNSKEFELRDIIKEKVKRGKVSLSIFIRKEGSDNKQISFDKNGLKEALSILEELKLHSKVDDEISLSHLLNFQNMFIGEATINPDEDFHIVKSAVDLAIKSLMEMKLKEGKELYIDIVERIKNIDETASKIENMAKDTTLNYFEKIRDRAKNLIEDLGTYDDRLNIELALLSEKYDVTEECVRMHSHTKMFIDIMENSEDAGKKLNFLCQEINREANTINSKSVSTEISYSALFMKEELEKIREQIQNIE
jgi:uncharacterized protein (TIGR00255 family)